MLSVGRTWKRGNVTVRSGSCREPSTHASIKWYHALAFLCSACSDVRHSSSPTAIPVQASGPACRPNWVYLKDPHDVDLRRGVDIPERNAVLIGCSEDLHRLTHKDRDALKAVFDDTLELPESELREMLKDSTVRDTITARANQALGRPVVSDWHVHFWSMAY